MSQTAADQSLEAPLLGNYRPLAGAYDELVGPDGQVRRHWQALISSLQRLSPEDLTARQDNIRRVLREHGATYNVYSEGDSLGRPWSLDLLPLLIPAAEWRQIEAGLIQRSHLLNQILGGFYGSQQLIKDGLLPPALLLAIPRFSGPALASVRCPIDFCFCMRGTWRAAPTAPGGCWATGHRRLPGSATHWRIGWFCPKFFRTSFAKAMFSVWPFFFKALATRCGAWRQPVETTRT